MLGKLLFHCDLGGYQQVGAFQQGVLSPFQRMIEIVEEQRPVGLARHDAINQQ